MLCPGVVATEFHTRQGLDMSVVARMSAEDVVTAGLRGLELGKVVCAPGVEDAGLLDAVFHADLAAFGSQSPERACRYRTNLSRLNRHQVAGEVLGRFGAYLGGPAASR
ncbi:hypothetical protein [Streptomyces sp. NPDC050564]|uniref:hypothetical protein n=1 Tax=Streptomyces sp. NPDC050564 TaxID=3365631 RepID=UPI00379D0C9C